MAFIPPLRPTFDAALRDVQAREPSARAAAASRLADADPEELTPAAAALRDLLFDRHPSVRREALLGLGRLDVREALDEVLEAIDDEHPSVREAAVLVAADLGGPAAAAAVERALASPHAEVRFQASMALARLRPELAPGTLAPLLADPDPRVRAHTAEALGQLADAQASDPLSALLDDESPAVRVEAAFALASLGDRRGLDVLVGALDHSELSVSAALALGQLEDPRAAEPLARSANRRWISPMFRAACGGALAQLGDRRAIEALRRSLHAWRADGRSLAAQLAGEHGLEELTADLLELAARPRGADVFVVVEALVRLTAKSPEARAGLEALGSRADALGELVRDTLAAKAPP